MRCARHRDPRAATIYGVHFGDRFQGLVARHLADWQPPLPCDSHPHGCAHRAAPGRLLAARTSKRHAARSSEIVNGDPRHRPPRSGIPVPARTTQMRSPRTAAPPPRIAAIRARNDATSAIASAATRRRSCRRRRDLQRPRGMTLDIRPNHVQRQQPRGRPAFRELAARPARGGGAGDTGPCQPASAHPSPLRAGPRHRGAALPKMLGRGAPRPMRTQRASGVSPLASDV